MSYETLKQLKGVQADFCVSILISTHRTHPENKQDPINLKNRIDEARDRLLAQYEKRDIPQTLAHFEELENIIDHEKNLDSLAVFINEDNCAYLQLPVAVKDRVVIDQTFATRDLIRALQQSDFYYVLTLSEKKAHLFSAFRDRLLGEIEEHDFPFENETLYTTDVIKLSHAQTDDRYAKEFFNRIDKQVQEILKQRPARLAVATTVENYHRYLEITDNKGAVIGQVSGNWDRENRNQLIEESWKVVAQDMKKARDQAHALIGEAESAKKLSTGVDDIYQLVNQGRGAALFVEENFFQPARLLDDGVNIELVDDPVGPGIVDDVIDEIIEKQLLMGGAVTFFPEGDLADYDKIALALRY